MASIDEAAIIALGKTPISDDAPCGQDVADDEEYLLVEAETAKLDRIDLGDPDWFRIEQASLNILRSKAKDVEIACALGCTLFKNARYAGLAAALGLFTELAKNFWDGLFPTRPRRRKVRIEALTERLVEGGWLRDAQPRPDEFDAIDRCVQRVAELQAALNEKMPDDPADFGKFTRKLKELAGQRPKAAGAPTPATGAPSPAPTAAGGSFVAGAVQDVSGAMSAVLSAATFLRNADPADPIPYALTRLLRWAKIELPTTDAGMHQIEPPEKSLVETLQFQFGNGVWEHLRTNAEAAFRSNDPLWLDLQRYVCAALQGLGPKFDRARATVVELTAGLVRRLGKGLYELTFRGGTPLCSGETKMWLESEVVSASEAAGGAGGSTGNGRLSEATAAARKLAGSGKLSEAVKGLQEGLMTCAQRRDRLLWRLRIAELCFDAKRLQLAAPLLEECYEETRRYHIDEWEPSLAVEVAQTLYRCRKALTTAEPQPTAAALDRVRESFAWLCQLDPLAALAAEPAGK
jgi:type VI secretion system protein VasJ